MITISFSRPSAFQTPSQSRPTVQEPFVIGQSVPKIKAGTVRLRGTASSLTNGLHAMGLRRPSRPRRTEHEYLPRPKRSTSTLHIPCAELDEVTFTPSYLLCISVSLVVLGLEMTARRDVEVSGRGQITKKSTSVWTGLSVHKGAVVRCHVVRLLLGDFHGSIITQHGDDS